MAGIGDEGHEAHGNPGSPTVDPTQLSVTVGTEGRSETWQPVSDLSSAGPDDAVFTLDPDSGQVIFGDGVHGRRPPAEALVQVRYRDGSGARGNVTGLETTVDGYDYRFQLTPTVATPPGKIRQIMPADGWYMVDRDLGAERFVPLVGWALLDPYFPPYRNGNEPPRVTTESVRGLIAPAGGPVRIVDELSATFGGYRR